MNENRDTRFQLTLTEGQCQALIQALDLYSRVGVGQIERVGELANEGVIPCFTANTQRQERKTADHDQVQDLDELLYQAKTVLGYPRNGSHGIGHRDNDVTVSRSYEIKKVLEKVLAETRDPNPKHYGVDRHGLMVRYTNDPAPEVEVMAMVPVLSGYDS
jgi:hypothetical protein